MKNVFYRLRDSGYIKLIRGENIWIKTENFDDLVKKQLKKDE